MGEKCTCLSDLTLDAYGPGGPSSGQPLPPPCRLHYPVAAHAIDAAQVTDVKPVHDFLEVTSIPRRPIIPNPHHDPLPGGWIADERGTRERKTIYWFPMAMAPRNGGAFVFLRRILHIGHREGNWFEFTVAALNRERSSPESVGYWRSASISLPDDYATGWWAHSVPFDNHGRMVLPFNAYETFQQLDAWNKLHMKGKGASDDEVFVRTTLLQKDARSPLHASEWMGVPVFEAIERGMASWEEIAAELRRIEKGDRHG